MADRPIPARSEVPEESTWNLRDVFESDEAWQAEYEALKAVPEQLEAFRGRLGESAETLLAWFRLNDALSVRLEKLYGYASCKGDEDTGNSVYQGMRAKALATLVAIDAASAFETPEIMALDEDTVNLFYAVQPALETYRRNIYKIRRRKAHILSPEEATVSGGEGTAIQFQLLPNQEGQPFFPAFTGWEELRKLCGPKNQQTLLLSFDDYAAMILRDNRGAGFVIDPFGCCLSFDRAMVEHLVGRKAEQKR